jgi:hypothetical protein
MPSKKIESQTMQCILYNKDCVRLQNYIHSIETSNMLVYSLLKFIDMLLFEICVLTVQGHLVSTFSI